MRGRETRSVRRDRLDSQLRQWWLNGACASAALPNAVRVRALRLGGIDIGLAGVAAGVRFIDGYDVCIGDGTFVNAGTVISGRAPVRIGTWVGIGANVTIQTSTHEEGPSSRRSGPGIARAIHVGDGAWIGTGAVILPGVSIGKGSVIAAGAVVNRDCEPDSLYVGVPARFTRALPSEDR